MCTEKIQIWQTIIQALGLIGVGLIVYQIYNTNKWNKLKETINFSNNGIALQIEKDLYELQDDKIIDFEKSKITESELNTIWNNPSQKRKVVEFLNLLEDISGAYNLGAFNKDYAYTMFSSKIEFHFKYFESFIEKIRIERKDSSLFLELEKLANEFILRTERDLEIEKDRNKKRGLKKGF